MPISGRLQPVLPDIDPTIAVAQSFRAEEQLRAHIVRQKVWGDSKVSLSAILLLFVIVIATKGLTEFSHEANAIMERLAARAEVAQSNLMTLARGISQKGSAAFF